MKVVLASQNAGKIQEFGELLGNKNIEIVPQNTLGIEEIEETGLSFIENALLKARHAAMAGYPALADDSGLVVPALNGAPGIYSARYAGRKATAQANIAKLLRELASTPDEKRAAYFYCVLVFMTHAQDPTPLICEGKWSGIIAKEPRGEYGFGYDPIFYLADINKTAAELPLTYKNKVSHRAIALKLLMEKL